MSIYTSLFRYRPRPTRTPHEDFVTAALADLLNRIPREASVSFVADILLAGHAKRQLWLDFAGAYPAASLCWVTQVGMRHRQGGIVDLLLLVDGREAIVIENKVGALVRPHAGGFAEPDCSGSGADAPASVSVAKDTQLCTYGNWLAARCKEHQWPGALVLLTHYTEAPEDFHAPGTDRYGVPIRGVCRWGTVWRWAKDMGARAGSDNNTPTHRSWTDLSSEFAEFLEEENMTSDCMTLHDVAAVEIFVSSAGRIEGTFEIVRKALKPLKDGLAAGRFHDLYYDGEGGVVWSWFYLREPQEIKDDWYFGWGIRFPSVSEWWQCDPPLSAVPHAFLALTTENSELPFSALSPSDIPAGWSITVEKDALITAKPLHEFRSDPDALATDFGEWAAASMRSVHPVLTALIGALSET